VVGAGHQPKLRVEGAPLQLVQRPKVGVVWYRTKEVPNGRPPNLQDAGILPECCGLVPVLYQGHFFMFEVDQALFILDKEGSKAAPGFMNPEGVVVYHTAGNLSFKKTIEKDEQPKGHK
jgi:hypothetical protein